LEEQGPQPQQIRFEVPVELATGVYANYALVHHSTEHEITLDFCQISAPLAPGESGVARVVARIYIAPSFVTPLLQAISANAFRQEDTLRQTREEGEEDEHTDKT
jgi:hypothetical protein